MRKAVFFDRDGTLLHRDPAAGARMAAMVEAWSGKPYVRDATLFSRMPEPEGGVTTLAHEESFYKSYYRQLLLEQGVTEALFARAETLLQTFWCKSGALYPETRDVLEAFRRRGYRMGVISDTYPSLRRTLEQVGIDSYFDCFICSAEVGVMKPDPRIYQAALDALHVRAEECLYVDDYDVEADGARQMGFMAFHLARETKTGAPWEIGSLTELFEKAEAL